MMPCIARRPITARVQVSTRVNSEFCIVGIRCVAASICFVKRVICCCKPVKSDPDGSRAGVSLVLLTALADSAKVVRGGSDVGTCVRSAVMLCAGVRSFVASTGRESVFCFADLGAAMRALGADNSTAC